MKWFNELDKKKRQIIVLSIFGVGAILIGLVWIAEFSLWLIMPGIFLIFFAIALQVDADKYDKKKQAEAEQQKEQERKQETEKAKAQRARELQAVEDEKAAKKAAMPGYITKDGMFFKLKDSYEVTEETTLKTTRIRGVYFNNIYDYELYEGEDVKIIHSPTPEYPENTEIYCGDLLIGHLMAEMAKDFVRRFGEFYEFSGVVTEIDTQREDLDDKNSDEIISKAIIEFEIPNFRKIKK